MDELTRRAERALLGAMIADPRLARLVRVRPEEFADARHGDWFRSILAAGHSLASADRDGLVADCPSPGHGLAYEVMVVQAWSRRFLQEAAQHAGARATEAGRQAQQAVPGDTQAAADAATPAAHMAKVATAIWDHTGGISSRTLQGSSRERAGTSAECVRREELVLAGLLRQAPQRAAEILRTVTAAAFSDPYRRKAFQVLSGMHDHERAIDELTFDWELAMHDVPVAGPGMQGWETYGTHLARIPMPSYGAPIEAAREVQALRRQRGRPHANAGKVPGMPSPRGAGRDAAPSARPGRPQLRLIMPPPEGGGPARGPEQR